MRGQGRKDTFGPFPHIPSALNQAQSPKPETGSTLTLNPKAPKRALEFRFSGRGGGHVSAVNEVLFSQDHQFMVWGFRV